MEVPFCFINERSFVQPIDVKNMLRFLSLSVRLLAAALANSPLRGSNRAPQLQLAQTNFTKTCYHFCQSTVVEGFFRPIVPENDAFSPPGTKIVFFLYLILAFGCQRYNRPYFCSITRSKPAILLPFCTSNIIFTAARYNLIIHAFTQRCRRFYQYCEKTIARLPKILFMLAATAELCLRLEEPS